MSKKSHPRAPKRFWARSPLAAFEGDLRVVGLTSPFCVRRSMRVVTHDHSSSRGRGFTGIQALWRGNDSERYHDMPYTAWRESLTTEVRHAAVISRMNRICREKAIATGMACLQGLALCRCSFFKFS